MQEIDKFWQLPNEDNKQPTNISNEAMNTRQTFKSSAKAAQSRRSPNKRDWPWDTIECGHSFRVELHEIKPQTLRPICSIKGRELGKKFRMIQHENCYEVARVK